MAIQGTDYSIIILGMRALATRAFSANSMYLFGAMWKQEREAPIVPWFRGRNDIDCVYDVGTVVIYRWNKNDRKKM